MSDDHTTQIVEAEPVAVALSEKDVLHPMVSLAMNKEGSLDISALKELMEIQRVFEERENEKAFTKAMISLKASLPQVIAHDKTVDYSSGESRTFYTHTSLAKLVEVVVPILSSHGFSHAWLASSMSDGKVKVGCRLTHIGGHSSEHSVEAAPDKKGGKNPAQAVASTMTQLQRHLLLAILGLATADMDDLAGNQAAGDNVVDPKRNMEALRNLKKLGISQTDAEAHVDTPVSEWTGVEIKKLRRLYDDVRAAKNDKAGAK